MTIDNKKDDDRQIIKKTSDERNLLTGSRVHHIDHRESNLHIHDLASEMNSRKSHICHKADQPADKKFPCHCRRIKEDIVRRRHRAVAVHKRKQHEGKRDSNPHTNAGRDIQTAKKRRDDEKSCNARQKQQVDRRMSLEQGVEIHGTSLLAIRYRAASSRKYS